MNFSDNVPDTIIDTANQLHRSILRLVRVLRASRPGKGLTLSGLSVLGCLYRDGSATATALAAYLHVQPQSLTRLVAGLERRKLITRRPNHSDRRQSVLEITTKGEQLLIETIHDQRVRLAQIIAMELTPAEQELLRIAAGLVDHIAEATDSQTLLQHDRM